METPKKKAGRPSKADKQTYEDVKASAKKLPKGYERYTVVLPAEDIEGLKNISYWDRKSMKQVAGEAFSQYIAEYKANNPDSLAPDGNVKARPANA